MSKLQAVLSVERRVRGTVRYVFGKERHNQATLQAVWKCKLACGHFEYRDNDGGEPPKKLKCSRCAKEVAGV